MRLRHAAAVALLLVLPASAFASGWYLMAPPVNSNGEPDLQAPLSKWMMEGSYDTAADCHAQHQRELDMAWRFKRENANSKLFGQEQAERCIATDDHRLTEH